MVKYFMSDRPILIVIGPRVSPMPMFRGSGSSFATSSTSNGHEVVDVDASPKLEVVEVLQMKKKPSYEERRHFQSR